VVSGSLWRFLFSSSGVINEALVGLSLVDEPILFITDSSLVLVSVAMVTAWVTLPFVAVVVRAAMLDLPTEVLEAASVDGASPWQSLRHITLPLLTPAIAVASVLVVVYAFRSFDFIYTMTSGGPGTASTTLPYLAYKLAFGTFRFSAGAAVAVVAGMFVLALAVVYSRNLSRGDHT
jgi:ABC-type sugar transport system permease subunit